MNRKLISWTMIIFWMILIFYLSHQPANKSNGLSSGITEKIVKIMEKVVPKFKVDIGRLNHIIRKNAHFFAYLILGILVSNGLRASKIIGFKSIYLALIICILYAVSDEIHQLFIVGRSGQISDVILDSIGSLFGIIGFKLLKKLV